MRWNTSKGEVAPVFGDTRDGYSYTSLGYMNVETKEIYSKEEVQCEIKGCNRTGGCECRSYGERFAGDNEDKCGTEEIMGSI